MEEFHTIEDIATLLKVSKMTIYRYIKAKKIIAIKLWKEYRISQTELDNFLSANSTK